MSTESKNRIPSEENRTVSAPDKKSQFSGQKEKLSQYADSSETAQPGTNFSARRGADLPVGASKDADEAEKTPSTQNRFPNNASATNQATPHYSAKNGTKGGYSEDAPNSTLSSKNVGSSSEHLKLTEHRDRVEGKPATVKK